MNSITLDQLDITAIDWIEQEAQRTGQPKEAVVLHLIYRGLETERQEARSDIHHDLDALAGTWGIEEADEFQKATEQFNNIDTDCSNG